MSTSAKQQLLDDIKSKALNKYDTDYSEYEKIEERFYSLVKKQEWDNARKAINEVSEEKGWDLEEEKKYLEKIIDPGEVETVEDKDIDDDASKREKKLIEHQISESDREELLTFSEQSIGVEHLFNLHESIYRNTGKRCFVISDQKTWQGRISVELSGNKEKFELMSVYENKDGELYFKHFGQNNPNKGYNKKDQLSKSFYQYKFVSEDKQYLALSTEKLDTVRCNLKGTKVSLNDYKTVGENRKLSVDQDIIFVHSVEPAVQTMTDKELEKYRNGLTHDDLMQSLIGDWRQPEWYEKLLFSILSVNEENGYPSHLINLSTPGTGKSKLVESILRSMDENQKEPFTGSGSTVKGLVPSFAENPPDEGYLLKTQRVAGVDEKMDLLSNSIKQNNGVSNDVFRPLLNLLTHDTRTFESGNGSIKGQMMSTMIATGNFNAYGIKNMKELAEKIDTAYLSRCIIYSYTQSHIEFINDRKAELKQKMQDQGLDEEGLYPERDDTFLSMMDTLREDKKAVIDFRKVKKVHDELKDAVPGYMREIFNQRGTQHMENIVLGLVKYNWLVGDRESFEAEPSDYKEMKKIFELIISGWDNVDTDKLSFEARKEALTPAQRRVFNVVNDNPGVTAPELAEKDDVKDLGFALTTLKRKGMIASDNSQDHNPVYPYWCEKYEEIVEDEEQDLNKA